MRGASKVHVVGVQARDETRAARAVRERREKELRAGQSTATASQEADIPGPEVPKRGGGRPENLRSKLVVRVPFHRGTSRVLGTAYPFLVASGETLQGPYLGENMLARSPFCYDPWLAYSSGVVRSHSAVIIGVKGTGKSMLAKSWACGLIRMGRKVAVPHDPNGEWARVAQFVDGKTVSIGRGRGTRINPLDPGTRDRSLTDAEWAEDVLQFRRATLKTIVTQLRGMAALSPFEHTTIDLVLTFIGSGSSLAS